MDKHYLCIYPELYGHFWCEITAVWTPWIQEPDQKRFLGHVPCPCNYCVRGFQHPFSQPTFPLPFFYGGRKGLWEEQGRQV